jgi:hypothetical protein
MHVSGALLRHLLRLRLRLPRRDHDRGPYGRARTGRDGARKAGEMIMSVPAGFKRITLQLARSREFPQGSARHGYEIIAPLDADNRLDVETWRKHREACRVRRFWAGERTELGHLVHRAGGRGGSTWVFDYDAAAEDDDEAGFRLGDHVWVPGEYVSIRDDDGEMHTFRVVTVEDVG